jgi:hypothetical protein
MLNRGPCVRLSSDGESESSSAWAQNLASPAECNDWMIAAKDTKSEEHKRTNVFLWPEFDKGAGPRNQEKNKQKLKS